ncbi:hypothetical protein DENSPDRAFT_885709 [Dentipellis sp. KUC8613]|nr:hypothetical protein DENSPDRAFT_885709 [Dentipellis sp. KUC8613]
MPARRFMPARRRFKAVRPRLALSCPPCSLPRRHRPLQRLRRLVPRRHAPSLCSARLNNGAFHAHAPPYHGCAPPFRAFGHPAPSPLPAPVARRRAPVARPIPLSRVTRVAPPRRLRAPPCLPRRLRAALRRFAPCHLRCAVFVPRRAVLHLVGPSCTPPRRLAPCPMRLRLMCPRRHFTSTRGPPLVLPVPSRPRPCVAIARSHTSGTCVAVSRRRHAAAMCLVPPPRASAARHVPLPHATLWPRPSLARPLIAIAWPLAATPRPRAAVTRVPQPSLAPAPPPSRPSRAWADLSHALLCPAASRSPSRIPLLPCCASQRRLVARHALSGALARFVALWPPSPALSRRLRVLQCPVALSCRRRPPSLCRKGLIAPSSNVLMPSSRALAPRSLALAPSLMPSRALPRHSRAALAHRRPVIMRHRVPSLRRHAPRAAIAGSCHPLKPLALTVMPPHSPPPVLARPSLTLASHAPATTSCRVTLCAFWIPAPLPRAPSHPLEPRCTTSPRSGTPWCCITAHHALSTPLQPCCSAPRRLAIVLCPVTSSRRSCGLCTLAMSSRPRIHLVAPVCPRHTLVVPLRLSRPLMPSPRLVPSSRLPAVVTPALHPRFVSPSRFSCAVVVPASLVPVSCRRAAVSALCPRLIFTPVLPRRFPLPLALSSRCRASSAIFALSHHSCALTPLTPSWPPASLVPLSSFCRDCLKLLLSCRRRAIMPLMPFLSLSHACMYVLSQYYDNIMASFLLVLYLHNHGGQ